LKITRVLSMQFC